MWWALGIVCTWAALMWIGWAIVRGGSLKGRE